MTITNSPDRSDVNDTSLTSKVVAVSTSAVELFTGGSRSPVRQALFVYNDGSSPVYLGPATVTASGATKGIPLVKGQAASFPIGNVAIFAIAASGSVDVIVQELT